MPGHVTQFSRFPLQSRAPVTPRVQPGVGDVTLSSARKGVPQALVPGMNEKRTLEESQSAVDVPVVGGATEIGAGVGTEHVKASAVPMVPVSGPYW